MEYVGDALRNCVEVSLGLGAHTEGMGHASGQKQDSTKPLKRVDFRNASSLCPQGNQAETLRKNEPALDILDRTTQLGYLHYPALVSQSTRKENGALTPVRPDQSRSRQFWPTPISTNNGTDSG